MRSLFILSILAIVISSCTNGTTTPTYKTIPTEGYERRPMNRKVDKQFPFDIDVRVNENEIANTREVLGNNNKPVVLSFWLTTCVPCFGKFSALTKKYDEMKSEVDFEYYGISIDYDDHAAKVFPSAVENAWPFPILHDLNREFRRTLPGGLNGMPQSFVYDASGNLILHQRKGDSVNFEQLVATLKAASK